MEALVEQAGRGSLILCDGLQKGQRARILSGPFVDFVGTLERFDENGRVRILIGMMGTAVPVAVDRSILMPAA